MANILNDYFGSVFIKHDSEADNLTNMNYEHSINDLTFTINDISKKIDDLKFGKAPGFDGISTNLIKNLKNE